MKALLEAIRSNRPTAEQRRLRRVGRSWLNRAAVLMALVLAYRLGLQHAPRQAPVLLGRETRPDMIGTRHPAGEIAEVIAHQPCQRPIHEVILHHTFNPSAAEYHGEPSIEAILRFHAQEKGWHNIAYHYLVAPDGTTWLGRPLDQDGTHVVGQNVGTVAVCLVLNGDVEAPSAVQVKACTIILRTLLQRFGLRPEWNFRQGHGFHRDYADKTCPGSGITKQAVLGWLATADPPPAGPARR